VESTAREGHWRSYGVGIDTHSQFITVTVIIPDYVGGKEHQHRKSFPTDVPSLKCAKAWVQALLLPVQPTTAALHYTLESSATYHIPVVMTWGDKPSVINPAHAKLGTRKTDDIDSGSLAMQDLHGRWPVTYLHSPTLTAARVLLKERSRWTRIAGTLRKAVMSGLNRFGHAFQTLRKNNQDPYPIVEDFLRNGKVDLPEANKCIGSVPIPKTLADYWVEQLVNSTKYQFLAKQHQAMAKELIDAEVFTSLKGHLAGKHLLKLLESVPGVGSITAATFAAEVGDIGRFNNVKACVAWSGFDPSLKVSAGKVTAHVTRGGHRHLHWLLCEAAGAVLRMKDCSLTRWGQNIAQKHKKGGHAKAVGALGRRIVEGMYYTWTREEEWKPSKQLEKSHATKEEPNRDRERDPSAENDGRSTGRGTRPRTARAGGEAASSNSHPAGRPAGADGARDGDAANEADGGE